MVDPPTGIGSHSHGPPQEHHRIGAFESRVIGRKVLAKVPKGARSEDGVDHRVREKVTVGGSRDPKSLRNDHPTEQQRRLAIEAVGVESPTDTRAGR
jgi:hypothetical protein